MLGVFEFQRGGSAFVGDQSLTVNFQVGDLRQLPSALARFRMN